MTTRSLRTCALLVTLASVAPAQQQIPVRSLGPAEAVSKDTIGFLYGVRELSDGRLIANDVTGRRLMMFDRSLSNYKVIADSVMGSENSYGRAATGIIPYAADSTLLIDLGARAFLVFDPKGNVTRVMSPPRPGDIGYMWNPALGSPRFDARGGLIYRSWIMPRFKAPETGKPFVAPEMPDSAPLLRGDFDRRTADTLTWIRIAKMRVTTTPIAGGGVSLSPMINPLASIDDWAVLPDGAIAILRGQDYHIDWINADGSRTSSPKMPFDWKRLTDAEKSAIVDSTRRVLEKEAMAGTLRNPFSEVPGHGTAATPGGGGHSMTIVPVTTGDGGPPPKSTAATAPAAPQVPEVIPPHELPDYVPPVLRSGTMKADPQGNIWILPSTSAQSAGGLLYDVINRQGEVFQRVRLPAGRALEGFGANGAVYMTSHDATGARLERARLK
jgi:hypothetical protein